MTLNRYITGSALCFFALLFHARTSAQEVALDGAQQKITAVSAVRVRMAPNVGAEEIVRLRLGTVLSADARSTERAEIGGRSDYWYRVGLPTGEPGWIFGGLLKDYDPARRQEIVEAIFQERLNVEEMSFDDGVDFHDFIAREAADAPESTRGMLELMRLHALDRAVRTIPIEQHSRPPYRDFHKAHASQVYFHELAGVWAVKDDAFWKLERRYSGSATGERIAWDAAQALRPGECESSEVCNFLDLCQTQGQYLSLYPNGAHAGEAVRSTLESLSSEEVSSALASKGGDKYAVAERKELTKAIAALRPVVKKTSAPEKDELLAKLDELTRR